MAAVNCVVLT